MSNSQSKHDIIQACDKIKKLLLDKNEKYGDAALNPTRCMSRANAVEQILVRIDDKLNRIQKGAGLLASDEDVVQDLAGYFILLMIALERQNNSNFESCKNIISSVGKPYAGLDAAWDEADDSSPNVDVAPHPSSLVNDPWEVLDKQEEELKKKSQTNPTALDWHDFFMSTDNVDSLNKEDIEKCLLGSLEILNDIFTYKPERPKGPGGVRFPKCP